jgi:hypothetical protein
MDRLQETQDRVGRDLGLLGLGVVPGVGHHDEFAAQGLPDPLGLGARIGEVGILLTHHDQGGR